MPTDSLPLERRMLVRAGLRRGKRHLVVLSAPHRQAAVHADLGLEDEGDAALDRFAREGATPRVNERERRLPAGRVAQHLHHAHHRIVVERDVARVVVAEREELRPAAVGILRRKQIVEAGLERGAEPLGPGRAVHKGEKPQLRGRGAVVDGRVRLRLRLVQRQPLVVRERARHVDVLGPSAGAALVEEHLVGHADSVCRAVPRRRLVQAPGPGERPRRRRGRGRRGDESRECRNGLAQFGVLDARRVAVFADDGDVARRDVELFAVHAVSDEDHPVRFVVFGNRVEGRLNGAEVAAAVLGDDDVGALARRPGRRLRDGGCARQAGEDHDRREGQGCGMR